MAAVGHLGFIVRMRGTTHVAFFVVFITVQNLVRIGSVVLIILKFNDLMRFGWKLPIHTHFVAIFGGFDP